jgi:hypothetical protein
MKNMFFLMKTCQSYAPKVPFKTYWTCCISRQKKWTFLGNWPHQICSPSWNHWMSHLFPGLFYHQVQESIWFRSACGFYVRSSSFRPPKKLTTSIFSNWSNHWKRF